MSVCDNKMIRDLTCKYNHTPNTGWIDNYRDASFFTFVVIYILFNGVLSNGSLPAPFISLY